MAKKETAAAISDFNLKKLNPRELEENLACTIQGHGNAALFGRRGTGKTHISKQAIAASDTEEVYLNLSVLERVDLGGYPDMLSARDPNADRRFLEFIMPFFYKKMMEGNKRITLLLDEVDKADPSLWAPLLEIVQFRSCNGRELKNLVCCIMTGNLAAEGGSRPSLPLLDRAEKYLVESDHRQWLEWAGRSREIHPACTAYINDHPEHLFGDVDEGDVYASASPRGWHNASKLLKVGEENNWPVNVLVTKVSGCIGKQIGMQFQHYYDHYQVLLPVVEKIFKGQPIKEFDKMERTKQIVCAMITCARLAARIDDCKEGTYPEVAGLIAKFLLNIESEIALIAARSQINLDRLILHGLDEEPGWSKLLDKINDRIA